MEGFEVPNPHLVDQISNDSNLLMLITSLSMDETETILSTNTSEIHFAMFGNHPKKSVMFVFTFFFFTSMFVFTCHCINQRNKSFDFPNLRGQALNGLTTTL